MRADPSSRVHRVWLEWARPLLLAVLLLSSFRSAVADWNHVPTGSMRPSILAGDRVLVDKTAYAWRVPFFGWRLLERADPRRGDIVIFPSPADGERYVKRVIGLPGDRIEIRDDRLFVNGTSARYEPAGAELLPGVPAELQVGRRLLVEATARERHPILLTDGAGSADFGPVVVPAGTCFVLGDDRDHSVDSRTFGPVLRDSIVGRAFAVALSVDPDHGFRPRWSRCFSRLP